MVFCFIFLTRAEMEEPEQRLRNGLLLEIFARCCGAQFEPLCRQVDCVNKLTQLTLKLRAHRDLRKVTLLIWTAIHYIIEINI